MLRAFRAGAAGGLLLAVAGGGLSASGAGAACSTGDAGGGWLASTPSFTAGSPQVTMLAASAFDPDLLFASNGSVVMRSADAGCTWQTVLSATSADDGAALPPRITALAAPSSATNSSFVYAGVTSSLAGVPRPTVVVSKDRGARWTPTTSGLPVTGTVTEVAASPALPSSAFAVVATGLPVLSRSAIYATGDAGASWSPRTATGDRFDGAGLTVSPIAQTTLYDVAGAQVEVSRDGGASFAPSPSGTGITQLASAPGAGGLRLAGLRGPTVARSDDAGSRWRTEPLPAPATAVALAPLQDLVVSSGGRDTWITAAAGSARISPAVGPLSQLAISAPTAGGFAVTGLANGKVLRVVLTLGATGLPLPVPASGLHPVTLLPPGSPQQFPALLQPASLTVTLPAGATTRVPYRLLVPRTPTPVDLMFLVDTTGSMGGVIDGLRADLARIVDALTVAGLDARFGVAEFRDYPDGSGSADYPYRLRRTIGPANANLRSALDQLQAGGGGDGPEADLTAMVQSSTGQGQEPWVARGLQADYRPSAFRFALVATDAEFHHKGDDYGVDQNGKPVRWPGPTMAEGIAALLSARVHTIGLAVSDAPVHDMTEVARATRALAPAGGTDCNGDGRVDVAAGSPLVCRVGDTTTDASGGVISVSGPTGSTGSVALAGAVVSVVNGIADPQPVRLGLSGGAGVAALASTAPVVVNLKADNELTNGLVLHCPVGPPASHRMALQASTPSRLLTESDVTLNCGGKRSVVLTPLPPAAAAVAVAAPAAPQPPATQPLPNPNPNVNPNANPVPNVNGNVAAADATQDEPQLAYATHEAGTDSLAMSWAFVGTAALMLTACVAVVHRRRTQAATAGS